MNLYRISQDVNNNYDTYDSAIVVAENEELAVRVHPSGYLYDEKLGWYTIDPLNGEKYFESKIFGVWAKSHNDVKVELIGTAKPEFESGNIILASYNAG